MTTNKYVNLIESKFISISGDDSKNFLQGLITNDINKCDSKNAIYSCLLSPQGKFLCDFFIKKGKEKYIVEIHNKYKEEFLNKLNIYKLRSKIVIDENEEYNSIIILFFDDLLKLSSEIINFIDPRNNNLGIKIFVKKKEINDIVEKYNLNEVDLKFYKELLIKNLIPFTVDDLIINKSLLLENNFENINAIDWEKGCYVGQEITARMKYRSLLKKSIRALEILSGTIKPGYKILNDQNEIGEILSYTNNFAMGMIKIEEAKVVIKEKKILRSNSAELRIIK